MVRTEPLVFNPNNAVTDTVERLTFLDGSTAVRKVLVRDAPLRVAHWPAGVHPGHWNYWRREVDAYDLGVVRAFEPHVRAPALLHRATPREGVEELVLEDASGRGGFDLEAGELALFSERLGRAQGSAQMHEVANRFPAASREWIWAYATSRPPGPWVYQDDRAWDHPVVIEGFGADRELIRRRFGELTAQLWWWRRVLAACPRSFCHLDFWSPNMVLDDSGPVLLDWSFCGAGAVGEDPGNLVPDVMLDHQFAPDEYDRLDASVDAAYRRGLAASGWPHPLEWARLGACASVAKYAWLPALMVANAGHQGPTGYAGTAGPELTEVFTKRAAVLASMLDRLDEARALAHDLDVNPLV